MKKQIIRTQKKYVSNEKDEVEIITRKTSWWTNVHVIATLNGANQQDLFC
jgi:chitodextrinase